MQAKATQDAIPGYKAAGHGVWISFQLWRHLMAQLASQMSEITEWEGMLWSSQDALGSAHKSMADLEDTLRIVQQQAKRKVAELQKQIAKMEVGWACTLTWHGPAACGMPC